MRVRTAILLFEKTHTHTHEQPDPTFTLAGFNLGRIEEPLSNGSTIISIMWNTSSVKFLRSRANLFAAVADCYSLRRWFRVRDKSFESEEGRVFRWGFMLYVSTCGQWSDLCATSYCRAFSLLLSVRWISYSGSSTKQWVPLAYLPFTFIWSSSSSSYLESHPFPFFALCIKSVCCHAPD